MGSEIRTSNNDILEPPRNRAVPPLVKDRLIPGMQPQHPALVAHHDLGRLLRVIPIPCLQLVPADAELAPCADGHDLALSVHNLGHGVRHEGPHGGEAHIDGVVGEGVEARRARLGQPVARRELGHAQPGHELLHQAARHGRARHDARPQPGQVPRRHQPPRLGQRQQAVEHGGHAVQRGAPFLAQAAQRRGRVEHLGRVGDAGAVRERGQQAQHQAEAVEHGRRAAQGVVGPQAHAVADEAGVVDQVVVRQHGRLGQARRPARELQVAHQVGEHLRLGLVQPAWCSPPAPGEEVAVGGVAGRRLAPEDDDLRRLGPGGELGEEGPLVEAADLGGGEEDLAFWGVCGWSGSGSGSESLLQKGTSQNMTKEKGHTREVKPVLRLGRGVRVVEDDEDGADAGGGEEDGGVLFAVAGHDADPVADADAHLQQGGRQQPAVVVELVVGPPRARPGDHDGLPRPVVQALQVEQLPECQVDQRRVRRPVQQRRPLRLREHEAVLDGLLYGDVGCHCRRFAVRLLE